jgi:hypothetical protein
MAGRPEPALECLKRLEELSQVRYVQSINRAIVLLGLNRVDEAVPLVEKAIDDHEGWCVYLAVENKYARLREHPRYPELYKKIFGGR